MSNASFSRAVVARRFLRSSTLTSLSALLISGSIIFFAIPSISLGVTPEQIKARKPIAEINNNAGLAVKGYDVVAYFTDGKPVKGSPQFSYKWKGATYQFASAAHRSAFQKEPNKYIPQYGGYCSFAISLGEIVDIDPDQWKIVGGKLYLNANAFAQRVWSRDPEGHIKKGDANWPLVPRYKL